MSFALTTEVISSLLQGLAKRVREKLEHPGLKPPKRAHELLELDTRRAGSPLPGSTAEPKGGPCQPPCARAPDRHPPVPCSRPNLRSSEATSPACTSSAPSRAYQRRRSAALPLPDRDGIGEKTVATVRTHLKPKPRAGAQTASARRSDTGSREGTRAPRRRPRWRATRPCARKVPCRLPPSSENTSGDGAKEGHGLKTRTAPRIPGKTADEGRP